MSTVTARRKPDHEKVWNFAPPQNNEKRILAFSGKLGSGKTSCVNFIHALAMVHLLLNENGTVGLTPEAFVSDKGKLVVKLASGDYAEFDLRSQEPDVKEYLANFIHPVMRLFSTAEPLKNIVCEMFGLDPKLVWGSQEDKKELTHLKWENMPTKVCKSEGERKDTKVYGLPQYKTGPMSVRDVLEYVGTEIFRKIQPDCHAIALANMIKNSNTHIVLIDDIRFLNELKTIQDLGGKVVRLTLTTEEAAANTHQSNVELDDVPEGTFDFIIDNQNLTMEEAFGELMGYLMQIGWFEEVA